MNYLKTNEINFIKIKDKPRKDGILMILFLFLYDMYFSYVKIK